MEEGNFLKKKLDGVDTDWRYCETGNVYIDGLRAPALSKMAD